MSLYFMYPPSYLTLLFTPLLIIHPVYASYIYPFVFIQFVVGSTVSLLLLFSERVRYRFYKTFSGAYGKRLQQNRILFSSYMLFVIALKLYILYIWPINVSFSAFVTSFLVFLSYLHFIPYTTHMKQIYYPR